MSSTAIVMDDVSIVSGDSVSVAAQIFDDYSRIGLLLNGKKLRVLTRKSAGQFQLPAHLWNATVVDTPTIVNGTIVIPNRDLQNVVQLERALFVKFFSNHFAKLSRLITMHASVQDKTLIMLAVCWNLVFAAETITSTIRDELFAEIDARHARTLLQIFGIKWEEASDLQVRQLTAPDEDGGFELLPYAIVHAFLRSRATDRAKSYLRKFQLLTRVEDQRELATSLANI
jgi:hypothetical protein